MVKKIATFSDIHFGNHHNSEHFNQDCSNFIDWFIIESKKRKCDTFAFLGDWHHNRNAINVSTLNYTVKNLRKLSNAFKKGYFIIGNHDLFFREKRDLTSLPMLEDLTNIQMINDITVIDDCAFVPWLMDDEWNEFLKIDVKYVFGHFELPGFYMNANVKMPDHGNIHKKWFDKFEYVFSGHFHKRQNNGKVYYIGNPFGHNFNDANDFERGAMFFDTESGPEFLDYTEGPKYIYEGLSRVKKNPDAYLNHLVYAKLDVDCDMSYDECSDFRERMMKEYNCRGIKFIHPSFEHLEQETQEISSTASVDEVVSTHLLSIESEILDNNLLLKLYNELEV